MGKNAIRTTLRQLKKEVNQTCYCCRCGKNSIKLPKDLGNQENDNLEGSHNQEQKDDVLNDDDKRHCHRNCGCRKAGRVCKRCLPMLINPRWCDNQKKSKPDDENSSSDREENEKPNTEDSSDEYEEENEDNLPSLRRNKSSNGNLSQNKRNTRSSNRSSKELKSKQKISTNKEISSSQDQHAMINEIKDDTNSPNPCEEVPVM